MADNITPQPSTFENAIVARPSKAALMANVRKLPSSPSWSAPRIAIGPTQKSRVRRSSGNPAYDQAVERAVLKASPFEVPSGALFDQLREVNLKVRPK